MENMRKKFEEFLTKLNVKWFCRTSGFRLSPACGGLSL